MNVRKTNATELYNINLLSQNPNLEACCSNRPATYSSVHCILIGGIYKNNAGIYKKKHAEISDSEIAFLDTKV